jgi:hypothetical protein
MVIVPQTASLLFASTVTFAFGICLFGSMAMAGRKRTQHETATLDSRSGSGMPLNPNRLRIHER